ncbi:hypothetical protein [Rhodoligotrophos defluvii]|uniref:hypothetical protein n=1 Tax=Rhodoligotrophos defluvii TaxID=2561934 RepID=UPI0010C95F5D|nr:hypothetical protein [Rhodoligotrophos defluvii]
MVLDRNESPITAQTTMMVNSAIHTIKNDPVSLIPIVGPIKTIYEGGRSDNAGQIWTGALFLVLDCVGIGWAAKIGKAGLTTLTRSTVTEVTEKGLARSLETTEADALLAQSGTALRTDASAAELAIKPSSPVPAPSEVLRIDEKVHHPRFGLVLKTGAGTPQEKAWVSLPGSPDRFRAFDLVADRPLDGEVYLKLRDEKQGIDVMRRCPGLKGGAPCGSDLRGEGAPAPDERGSGASAGAGERAGPSGANNQERAEAITRNGQEASVFYVAPPRGERVPAYDLRADDLTTEFDVFDHSFGTLSREEIERVCAPVPGHENVFRFRHGFLRFPDGSGVSSTLSAQREAANWNAAFDRDASTGARVVFAKAHKLTFGSNGSGVARVEYVETPVQTAAVFIPAVDRDLVARHSLESVAVEMDRHHVAGVQVPVPEYPGAPPPPPPYTGPSAPEAGAAEGVAATEASEASTRGHVPASEEGRSGPGGQRQSSAHRDEPARDIGAEIDDATQDDASRPSGRSRRAAAVNDPEAAYEEGAAAGDGDQQYGHEDRVHDPDEACGVPMQTPKVFPSAARSDAPRPEPDDIDGPPMTVDQVPIEPVALNGAGMTMLLVE